MLARIFLSQVLVAVGVCCYDVISALPWPNVVEGVFNGLSAPFTDFITLEDVDEKHVPLRPQTWRPRVMILLSSLACVGWIGVLSYSTIAYGSVYLQPLSLTVLSWVDMVSA